jgi:CTD nuclear envelope phosphatase 1
MDPNALLPTRPSSSHLTSHLSVLDADIARLSELSLQTRWPAYIPVSSRAHIRGNIIHPNEVKVDLGQGWWVDMTAAEAAAYLRRKKTGRCGPACSA